MRAFYDEAMSLQAAVHKYFADNQFSPDGGYSDVWVKLKLGPLTFYMPNSKARVAAVRIHDLHHVITGYRTDWLGEFEIAAWELATGCGRFYAAWWLNLAGLTTGLMVSPRRTIAAFLAGRRQRNLYGETYGPALLSETVGSARRRSGLSDLGSSDGNSIRGGSLFDWLLLKTYALFGLPVGLLSFIFSVLFFIPLALVQTALRRTQPADL